jgi:hypothetical protein
MSTYFETTLKENKNRERFWDVFTKYLQKYIPEDSSVLDIGAGRCEFINRIKAKYKTAVDKEDILEFASPDVNVITGDGRFLNEKIKYDTVFMSNFLEHTTMEDVECLLLSLNKICNQIIIFGPNYKYAYKDYWDDPTHKTPLSHITLKRLLEQAGFEVEICYPKIAPYSVEGSNFPIPKFLIWLYLHLPIRPFAGQMLIIARKK